VRCYRASALWRRARGREEGRLVPIQLEEDVRIPADLTDVQAFRRWAVSDDFPPRGRFAFLRDVLWVDLCMEQIFSHNQVKEEMGRILGGLVKSGGLGYFFVDGAFLSHPEVGLSTQPDGLFVRYDTLQKGRVQLVEGRDGGYVELPGAPDIVLEVVSAKSVHKDTVALRRLYWEAGVPEYWPPISTGPNDRTQYPHYA
jgi:hypothetical protein